MSWPTWPSGVLKHHQLWQFSQSCALQMKCWSPELLQRWTSGSTMPWLWEGNRQWIYSSVFQPSLSGCRPHYCTGLFLKILVTRLCNPHSWFTPSIITTWIYPAIRWCRECRRVVLFMQTISTDVFMATGCICFTETLYCSKLHPSYYLSFNTTLLDTLVCSWHVQRPSTFHKHKRPNHW